QAEEGQYSQNDYDQPDEVDDSVQSRLLKRCRSAETSREQSHGKTSDRKESCFSLAPDSPIVTRSELVGILVQTTARIDAFRSSNLSGECRLNFRCVPGISTVLHHVAGAG